MYSGKLRRWLLGGLGAQRTSVHVNFHPPSVHIPLFYGVKMTSRPYL